ncbi:MAG: ATPase [Gemmiger sp.]|nr:ATPase [Gemmiger sp.]
MNVDELLDLMEETLEEGTAMPFSAGKRVVDVDKMRDIIDDVRANLPDEMRQSKKIVEDRERILTDAQHEAETLVKQAEERAKALVCEQEIVKRAQKRAVEILTTAQTHAREISKSCNAYCEGILKNSEEVIARSIADIKNTRMNLRNAGNKAMRGPGGKL